MFLSSLRQGFRAPRHAALAVIALAVVAGGLASAEANAAPGQQPSKTVTKCVNVKSGAVRVIHRNAKCRKGEKKVTVTVPTAAKTCATGGSCALGDVGPGGGKVFYDAGSAQPWGRYLEAAPANWNAGAAEPFAPWCSVASGALPGANARTIGSGAANTTAMLTACSSGAGVLARAYTGGGLNDWYLPALDELTAMTTARGGKADVALGQGGYYWTSSQGLAPNVAWVLDYRGNRVPLMKIQTSLVRPIRAF